MDTLQLKILLISIFLIASLACGLAPIKVYRYLEDKKRQSLLRPNSGALTWPSVFISSLTCFAGGVFLAVIFLDLLPDAHNALRKVQSLGAWQTNYPVVELIALLGFFTVFLIEAGSEKAFGQSKEEDARPESPRIPAIIPSRNRRSRSVNAEVECEIHGREHVAAAEISQREANVRLAFRSGTFVLALVFHAAVEGFAFGIQPTQLAIVSLFLAISAHKSVVAFSVGLRLINCHPNNVLLVAGLVSVFALTSPVFAVFGMLLQASDMNAVLKTKVSLVLIGASIGTFMYISFFEMLAPEKSNGEGLLVKFLSAFIGFAIFASTVALAG